MRLKKPFETIVMSSSRITQNVWGSCSRNGCSARV